MKAYFIIDTNTGIYISGNHSGTFLCFQSKVAADAEIDYLNNKAPSAPLRERYVVEKKEI